ncbi:hypothetical protein C0992_008362, partial [Termitomyces sp. T32_za158]
MADPCAVGPDGLLVDADHIVWYHSETDETPLTSATSTKPSDIQSRRSARQKKTTRLQHSLEAINSTDNHGNLLDRSKPTVPIYPRKPKKIACKDLKDDSFNREESDEESGGSDFEGSGSESSDFDSEVMVDNSELAQLLPSKTIPLAASKKRKRRSTCFETIKQPTNVINSHPPLDPIVPIGVLVDMDKETTSAPISMPSRKRNAIYLFYEQLNEASNGEPAGKDKYYRCLHGSHKVLKVTEKMRYSTNGLVNHLKANVPVMYRFYENLHKRTAPPSSKEIEIAAGRKKLSLHQATTYVADLEKKTANIIEALQQQAACAKGAFDQGRFEELLAEWIVLCDQPFDEVDKPAFRALLEYIHRSSGKELKIPHRTTIRKRIMDMGDVTIGRIKDMFSKLDSKVSISLDAWTSNNQYAFLAVVAHYINNNGELGKCYNMTCFWAETHNVSEELLIDFCELIGEHSGENMAEAVWETLETYGLVGK